MIHTPVLALQKITAKVITPTLCSNAALFPATYANPTRYSHSHGSAATKTMATETSVKDQRITDLIQKLVLMPVLILTTSLYRQMVGVTVVTTMVIQLMYIQDSIQRNAQWMEVASTTVVLGLILCL